MHCTVLRPPHLSAAPTITVLALPASVGDTISYLFMVDAGNVFPRSVITCVLLLVSFPGEQHVARAGRVYTHCGGIAVANDFYIIHECPVLQPLRQQYAALFTSRY